MRNTRSASVQFRVPAKQVRWFYSLLLAGELFLTLGYLALKFGARDRLPWILHIVRNQLNLTSENVAAVWFSGMLLLSISFAAILCFQLDTRGSGETGLRKNLRYGWVVIALIFAGFSIDEIGSFHERLDTILPVTLTMQSAAMRHWVLALAPIMIVVFLFFLFFFFRQMAQSRRSQYLAVLGAVCLASVPFQEWISTSLGKGGHLLSVVEEATELTGMTLIFIAFLEFAISSAARATQSEANFALPVAVPVRFGVFERRVLHIIIIVSAVGTLLLAWYFVPLLEDIPSRGDPRAWYPSAVLFTAALGAIFVPYSIAGKSIGTETMTNASSYSIGFICLILSQERVSGVLTLTLTQLMHLIGLRTANWLAETLAWGLPLGLCLGIVSLASPRANRDRVFMILGGGFCAALVVGIIPAQMKDVLNLVVPTLIAVAILNSLRFGANRPNTMSSYATKRLPTSNL